MARYMGTAVVAAVAAILIISMATSIMASAVPGRPNFVKKLVVYMYPTTDMVVAGKNGSASSLFDFGSLAASDEVLRWGPTNTSDIAGHAQGLIGNVDLKSENLQLLYSFVFSSGRYNGSTILINGADAYLEPIREVAVIGGTGVFALAKGYAVVTTIGNTATGIAKFDIRYMLPHL